jgi:hypothetical protein
MPTATLPVVPFEPRKRSRKWIAISICIGAVAVSLTRLPQRGYAFAKLFAVRNLPTGMVSIVMGWDRSSAEYFKYYYVDGFARARGGMSTCLPNHRGEASRPDFQAWADGFKAGRQSGGTHAPPAGFEEFID